MLRDNTFNPADFDDLVVQALADLTMLLLLLLELLLLLRSTLLPSSPLSSTARRTE
jgi:hypothetical protein